MALPQKNSSLEHYYEASIYLTSSLQLESSIASLADPLVQLEQENRSLREQLESTRTDQIRAYVRVVQADRRVDDCIRDLSNAAKSADRKQPTLQSHTKIFPSGGFSELIQPSGRMASEQLKEVRKLFPVLQELSPLDSIFHDFFVQLESLCSDADTKLDALSATDTKMEQLHVQAELHRQRWRAQAYIVEGELQKLFPGQKDLVRTFFNTPSSRRTKKKETKTTAD